MLGLCSCSSIGRFDLDMRLISDADEVVRIKKILDQYFALLPPTHRLRPSDHLRD